MKTGTAIREARIDDAHALHAIDGVCFPGQRVPDFTQVLAKNETRVWVAETEGRIAGYLWVILQTGETDKTIRLEEGENHVLQVAAIAVDPDFQNNHIAQELAKTAEEALSGRFVAEVRPDNAASLKLWRHMGYSETAVLEDYYGEGRPALRLEKRPPPQVSVTRSVAKPSSGNAPA